MTYKPGHPLDAFFADLRALAEKHGMGPVAMGFKHDERHRLVVMLRVEDAKHPWGEGYTPANHPRRILPVWMRKPKP